MTPNHLISNKVTPSLQLLYIYPQKFAIIKKAFPINQKTQVHRQIELKNTHKMSFSP